MTDIDTPEPTPGTEIAGDFERRGTKMSERQSYERAIEGLKLASDGCRNLAAYFNRAGAYADCVAGLRPVLGAMHRLGGSHAQQDVLDQLFLDAALRAGLEGDVRLALERLAGRRVVPPSRWIGYRDAAARFPL